MRRNYDPSPFGLRTVRIMPLLRRQVKYHGLKRLIVAICFNYHRATLTLKCRRMPQGARKKPASCEVFGAFDPKRSDIQAPQEV